MAGATDQALTTQARYNLILAQSTDALGTAADESDSYAAKQESMNEKWQALLTAVGGPLISAFGPLVDVLGDTFTTLTPLITAVAELVGWVLKLPGPALAAVTAVAGWSIFGGKITEGITKFKDAMSSAMIRPPLGGYLTAPAVKPET